MKFIWNTICICALLSVLGVVSTVGWLWQTERLTSEHVSQFKKLFTAIPMNGQSTKLDPQSALVDESESPRLGFEELIQLDSETKIDRLEQIQLAESLANDRMRIERTILKKELAAESGKLKQERAAFERERQAWETHVSADRQRKNDEQFLQIIKQYELLPPSQSKEMLLGLIRNGNMTQAVTYLNAMNSRTVTKILREFQTESELALATELLENLRQYGQVSGSNRSGSPQHANDLASADISNRR